MKYVGGHDAGAACWPTGRCRRAKRPRCWRRSPAAIHFAHERGILHRDLKPSNILIDERGASRTSPISAWPSASEADCEPDAAPARSLGTPSYMAPEQAAGKRGKLGPRERRLQPGRDPLRDAHRPAAVSGRHAGGHLMLVAGAGAGAAAAAEPAGRSRTGDDLPQVPAEAARPALRHGRGSWPTTWKRIWPASRASARQRASFMLDRRAGFRETHHAAVLENWGLLWMWHSLALLLTAFVTQRAAVARRRRRRCRTWRCGSSAWALGGRSSGACAAAAGR